MPFRTVRRSSNRGCCLVAFAGEGDAEFGVAGFGGEGDGAGVLLDDALHGERFAHCAFIAETPVDAPGDEARNVRVLRTLAAG